MPRLFLAILTWLAESTHGFAYRLCLGTKFDLLGDAQGHNCGQYGRGNSSPELLL